MGILYILETAINTANIKPAENEAVVIPRVMGIHFTRRGKT
jgi:hypothetical protein